MLICKETRITRTIVMAALCLALDACGKECEIVALPSGDESKALFPSWHGQARQCHMGNYLVLGPPDAAAAKADGSLSIIKDGQVMVMIEGPKEIDISYQNQPVLTIQNRTDNGGYDFVSYKVRDSSGNYIGDVFDGDMDGQPDFKRFNDGKVYAYINGSWLPFERHGSQPGVVGPSGWTAVQREGPFRYAVSEK
jgi:hypothetical protein